MCYVVELGTCICIYLVLYYCVVFETMWFYGLDVLCYD